MDPTLTVVFDANEQLRNRTLNARNSLHRNHERVKNSRTRKIKTNTVYHSDYTLLIADTFYINIYSGAMLFQVIPIDMKNGTNLNLRARSYQNTRPITDEQLMDLI